MNWQEILIILVPILGLMSWVYTRIEKKLDHLETKLDHLETKMNTKFDDVIKVLHSLDMRLTRL